MGIEIRWYNEEKSIMYFRYFGVWEWQDALAKVAEANSMMDMITEGICVSIVDMSQTNYLPPQSGYYIRQLILQSQSHNNSGLSVFINADRVTSGVITLLTDMYPSIRDFSNFIYASDLAEAGRLAEGHVKRLRSSKSS
jgi:hypothetical protein